jgi:hypothetical protein
VKGGGNFFNPALFRPGGADTLKKILKPQVDNLVQTEQERKKVPFGLLPS